MVSGWKIVVIMPAFNAEKTLERTYRDIPKNLVDSIILVDDNSTDNTVSIARDLGIQVIVHEKNLGYGGNQKTCYRAALEEQADIVVMIHPDYQYDATKIGELVAPIIAGRCDAVFGSRILHNGALKGGMPLYKFFANKFLTVMENLVFKQHLSEYHTGLRAYSSRLLRSLYLSLNSDDFVFDTEIIAQLTALGCQIEEIPVETRYFPEASSINFRRSVSYGVQTLLVLLKYLLHQADISTSMQFEVKRSAKKTEGESG
ncbi:glycosyl transferase family 2 [candidate division KSB3 bacterium]|uniref:Glycosyl transferase family 2 n=1 Tax=candidate division KSB3 bacterium TaxID=2044937 RepID=A0A2G6E7V6_9BACT|nr:MAG: glycosyl transferase family 2 [candidate division KSB3 bacterium]PIE30484.1 MAG: glycosyl transferase family 2 [candidate division KSB3 bacterium]